MGRCVARRRVPLPPGLSAAPGALGEVLPAGPPVERVVHELLEREAVQQVVERPARRRVRHEQHAVAVVTPAQVVEQVRHPRDDLAIALAAGIRLVDPLWPLALEQGDRHPVQGAVVALTQARLQCEPVANAIVAVSTARPRSET